MRDVPRSCWRTRVVLLAAALLVFRVEPGGAQEHFSNVIEDLPLMAGLVEDADASAVFQTPQGRIVAVTAHGPVSARAVSEFYGDALPALGWAPAGAGRFRRGGEALQIEVSPGRRDLAVRFTVSPD